MKYKAAICILGLALSYVAPLFSQGCSDAGFCSIGNLAPKSELNKDIDFKRSIRVSLPVGSGDEGVFVSTPGIEYNHYFSKEWQFQSKITANYANGNLGIGLGLGDAYLSVTYQRLSTKSIQTSFTLGSKFPLHSSNLTVDGRSLPMQYQSSLGTLDLIAGVSVSGIKWQLAAGLQQPLSGTNGNNFLPAYWVDMKADAYPPSNDLKRKGDVLLRGTYDIYRKNKNNLQIGLLGIYHLGEDTYIDASVSNDPLSIVGSKGLTLNATANLDIILSNRFGLAISAGVPLVIRDVRPDGLTRSFVVSPSLSYKF